MTIYYSFEEGKINLKTHTIKTYKKEDPIFLPENYLEIIDSYLKKKYPHIEYKYLGKGTRTEDQLQVLQDLGYIDISGNYLTELDYERDIWVSYDTETDTREIETYKTLILEDHWYDLFHNYLQRNIKYISLNDGVTDSEKGVEYGNFEGILEIPYNNEVIKFNIEFDAICSVQEGLEINDILSISRLNSKVHCFDSIVDLKEYLNNTTYNNIIPNTEKDRRLFESFQISPIEVFNKYFNQFNK